MAGFGFAFKEKELGPYEKIKPDDIIGFYCKDRYIVGIVDKVDLNQNLIIFKEIYYPIKNKFYKTNLIVDLNQMDLIEKYESKKNLEEIIKNKNPLLNFLNKNVEINENYVGNFSDISYDFITLKPYLHCNVFEKKWKIKNEEFLIDLKEIKTIRLSSYDLVELEKLLNEKLLNELNKKDKNGR